MPIKDRNFIKILFFIFLILYNHNVIADEFNISAKEVEIDKSNNILVGKGSVKISDSIGRIINAENVKYEKSKEFLLVEGSVEIFDIEGNVLVTEKATYDKINELITTFDATEIKLNNGYNVKSNNIIYNTEAKIVSSNLETILTDADGNIVNVSMFQYQVTQNLFSSVGNIKVVDNKNNKYFFKELHIDTKKKEMIGSDVSVLLDQKNFGVKPENDPRFVSNDVYVTEGKTQMTKGVFTVCKKRDGKCPPWSLKAKKITHDKLKKTIYYKHATLKFYDVPIFYFPAFFHPDPTVERKSGFLNPFFSNSNSLGSGFGVPYFWAIDRDRDMTFTPKIYTKENALYLNEYRQAFKNGFLTLDTGFFSGYKNTSSIKTKGSKSHVFAKLDLNLSKDPSYESDFSLKTQRTSSDNFFRTHDINTALVNADNTNLENKINYRFSKNNSFIDISGSVYEDLREKNNSKYEYLPNILFGKTFFLEKFGTIDFTSDNSYRNYKVDKHLSTNTNTVIWTPLNYISRLGFVNSLEGQIKNTNYDAVNTTDYKTDGLINELSSVLKLKSSIPMKKESTRFSNILSPNFMLRYAPGHMKDLKSDDLILKYANLYSTNKTNEIESGFSSILGFDFKHNEKNNGVEKEKLSISVGQVFSPEKNKDLPSASSLDQKMSDVVGEIKYNFSEIGTIDYKFSLDHNYNDFNYNEVATTLNFGKVGFNIDYLEEQNHVGRENYVNAGVSINFNDNNKFSFETKKNFRTSSTELYDMAYQYTNDCLTAGLVFRREFYEDSDLEQKDTLMFMITFVPFTGAKAPLK